MEFKSKPLREIRINPTANGGYLVYVGCTHFAYTDEEALISDLGDYIRDPKGVEEEYNKHHKHEDVECAPEQPRSLGSLVEESETTTQSEQVPEPDPAESIEPSGY